MILKFKIRYNTINTIKTIKIINTINIINMSYINITSYKNDDYKINKGLAIFDLDYTLIKPKSKNIIATEYDDWMFLHENVPKILKKISNHYHIIVVTNQKLLSKTDKLKDDWIKKVTNIIKELNIKMEVYAAIKTDLYRKPSIGFFNIIKKKFVYDNNKCFFCGDAAGRPDDFTDVDLKFALNTGLRFKLPEEIFKMNNQQMIQMKSVKYPTLPQKYIGTFEFNGKQKDMLIMIGFPASGKSSVSKRIKRKNIDCNYSIINRDTEKTIEKCEKKCEEEIKNGKSVIIDNTNPSKESRKRFITIAKKYNYKIRAVYMQTTKELSMHNNLYRHYKYNCTPIPEIAYNIFNSKFEKPVIGEGFTEIVEVEPMKPSDLDYLMFYS